MQRRSFVKKSVAASILTPLALTGLINAAGATETGGTEYTTVPETTWVTTEGMTETTDLEYTSEFGATCSEAEMNDPSGVSNIESSKHDSSGKDIECVQYISCKNGQGCTKKWACTEWHADHPKACKDLVLDP